VNTGASMARRPKAPSSDDVTAGTRFVGVGGDRFVGIEVPVPLDGKAEFAPDGAKFFQVGVA
jgi:hypothetical protein